MIRVFDIFFSIIGILLLTPVMLMVICIGFFDTGSPIFFQTRVGRDQIPFKLIKIRTMALETPSVASHLIKRSSITTFGAFLRKTKVDELPQLWNVLIGDMSLVGPRPGLINQEELTHARESLGVYCVRPGITGLAQVRGVDMSTPNLLAEIDAQMISTMNVKVYFQLIFLTISGHGRADSVSNE